ncbi:MAG: glycosyltransferase family 2 protein [Nitrolancea sp.]
MTPDNQTSSLSVVIVSWNTRELLDNCLRVLRDDAERSHLSTELIVVDNSSTDGTVDMLRERHSRVRVVELGENCGFAAATNVGIRATAGAFVLLLNPDTEIQPGALRVLHSTLQAMPHVGLVSGLLLNPDGSIQSSGYKFPGLAQSLLDFFPLHPRIMESRLNGRVIPGDGRAPYAVDHPLGACMLVRRAAIERVGLLDEQYFMYSEEIDWCQRIRAAGWSILIAPEAKIVHFGGQSTSQMRTEMFLELHRSRARYFRRYQSGRFMRAVELMARAASRVDRERSDLLNSVADIYARARDAHG